MNNNKRTASSTGINDRHHTKKSSYNNSHSAASASQSGSNGKVKFNREAFLRTLKKLKLYVDGDRYYEVAKHKHTVFKHLNMDWKDEASALIDDIKNYVNKIELSKKHESSDTRIYFEIETLERVTLIVSMDANGFIVCDSESGKKHLDIHEDNSDKPEKEISEDDDTQQLGSSSIKVYETIYSLLDDNSPKYREAFAGDLYNRMRSLE